MAALLLDPAELQALMQADPSLLIVDLCRDETRQVLGHIPGAVPVNPGELISGEKPAVGKLPSVERLEALLARIGYTPERHVVAYDDEGGGWAGRMLWTLDVIGHDRFSALDGGIIAWRAAGMPLTLEPSDVISTEVRVSVDKTKIASKADVLASIEDAQTLVWDARSHEEHTGEKVVASRGGRVPGAVNLDWLHVMDRNNNLAIRKDLATVLNALGITPDKRIITHCQTHHRSALTWLAGKALGYDIRAYDGSWSEWGNDPDTPVETG